MGGEYPLGREFNFYGENPAIAAHVVDTWPSTMTFLGFEAGENVLSGVPLMEKGPGNDPVKAAYQWYKYVLRPQCTLYNEADEMNQVDTVMRVHRGIL